MERERGRGKGRERERDGERGDLSAFILFLSKFVQLFSELLQLHLLR